MLLALSALGFAPGEACSSALDCNGAECMDCSCTAGTCSCADGWSGPDCKTPFCSDRKSCSGHGECHQTAVSMSCACDTGFSGPHCESAACGLKCTHGGVADTACTVCQGCRGGWGGKLCETWDPAFPPSSVQQQLTSLKTTSQNALLKSLEYNPICRQGQECVGWGVDLGAGAKAKFPLLTLDFSGTTPTWHGMKYPAGTSVIPSQFPDFSLDTQVFNTLQEFHDFVDGKWSAQQGPIGYYAQNASTTIAQFDDPKDWFPSVTQATYELYHMTIDPDHTSPSGYSPRVDPNALAALQTVGPTYAQDPDGWSAFFENWGTSVVLESHSGGMLQLVTWASTALKGLGLTEEEIVAQARLLFTNATGLGHHTGALDPTFLAHYFGPWWSALGGDASLAPYLQKDLSAWVSSITQKPTLTTFKLAPLSTFVEDAALATALENATGTYIELQRAKWAPLVHCPPACGHLPYNMTAPAGTCNASVVPAINDCTCPPADYWGRQCSVFIPAPVRPVYLSCSSPHNNCDPKAAGVGLGGSLESDFAGSKGRKCFCLRDAQGNLTAEVNYNFQQPLCYGVPQWDWSKAASACNVGYACSCHYIAT